MSIEQTQIEKQLCFLQPELLCHTRIWFCSRQLISDRIKFGDISQDTEAEKEQTLEVVFTYVKTQLSCSIAFLSNKLRFKYT